MLVEAAQPDAVATDASCIIPQWVPSVGIARLGELIPSIAEAARIASLSVIEPCEYVDGLLRTDPTLARHVRTVIFRPPKFLSVARQYAAWAVTILMAIGDGRHLVVDAYWRDLDVVGLALLGARRWGEVSVKCSTRTDVPASAASAAKALAVVIGRIAAHAHTMSVHLSDELVSRAGIDGTEPLRVRRLRVSGDASVTEGLLERMFGRAPKLVDLDVHADAMIDLLDAPGTIKRLIVRGHYCPWRIVQRFAALEHLDVPLASVKVEELRQAMRLPGLARSLRLRLQESVHLLAIGGALALALHPAADREMRLSYLELVMPPNYLAVALAGANAGALEDLRAVLRPLWGLCDTREVRYKCRF